MSAVTFWASLFLCPVSNDIGVFHWRVISGPVCMVSSGENFTGNSSSTRPNVSTFLSIPEPLRESFCKWCMGKNSPLSPSVCIYLDCIHRVFSKSFQLQVCFSPLLCFLSFWNPLLLSSLQISINYEFPETSINWLCSINLNFVQLFMAQYSGVCRHCTQCVSS